jgi:hypothetical protein
LFCSVLFCSVLSCPVPFCTSISWHKIILKFNKCALVLWTQFHCMAINMFRPLMRPSSGFAVQTVSSLNYLHHNWTHVACLVSYVRRSTNTKQQFSTSAISYLSLLCCIAQPWIWTKDCVIVICGVIETRCNYVCVHVLAILKVATGVTEVCRWPPCNEITAATPTCSCCSLLSFIEILCNLLVVRTDCHGVLLVWVISTHD